MKSTGMIWLGCAARLPRCAVLRFVIQSSYDKVQRRIARLCKQYAPERVQKSAFLGMLETKTNSRAGPE